MTAAKNERKSELIAQVIAFVHDRLEGERAETAERFVRRFYAQVPPGDLVDETPENLYGAALTLLKFARERTPGSPKVRVYNPRLESEGWKSRHTLIEIVNDDMPFLVDSVVAAVHGLQAEVHLVIHPVFHVMRDGEGRLTELYGEDKPDGASDESMMQIQISEQPPELHRATETAILAVLADVRAAVDDWQAMRQHCRELIAETEENPPVGLQPEDLDEGVAFLAWLDADNFTYLGYREYRFVREGEEEVARVLPDRGLGILRDDAVTVFAKVRHLGPMPEQAREFLQRRELLVISKANRRSTVHRAVHLDAVAVKTFDESGKVIGQRLFVGLFTSAAYSTSPRQIPLLRRKVKKVLDRSGFLPGSHDSKALIHILDAYPRDELFQITDETLFDISLGILHLQERQRIAFFPRRDAFERYVSCLVYVPRDRHDTALRMRLQDILTTAYAGEFAEYYAHLTDSKLVRLHFIIKTTPGHVPNVDPAALEQKLIEAGRSWIDRLRSALVDVRGEEKGVATLHRFSGAFSASYQDHFGVETAVADIAGVEEALTDGLALNLYRAIESEERELRLKIYVTGKRVPLSEVLPMLENMGLKVIDEIPFEINPAGVAEPVWMRDFAMEVVGGHGMALGEIRATFHDAFQKVWRREMENDGFNRLVLCAGLGAREVTVLRALCKYLLQVQIPFSQAFMEETLASNPGIARLLVGLFLRRFDPAPAPGARSEAELNAAIEHALEHVTQLDRDSIIRRFRNLILSALRTNYFQHDVAGAPRPYLSIKFDSQALHDLPAPRPFREIFVYSPRVEAVHLRGGRVARGGIRWSDRREDFRTEVLGLMKAQMVKNAVIVPVGSKGGFVVKQPPEGRDAFQQEGIECYRTMLRGILDLTDNLVGGEVVPPGDVVRHDDDDPYLVVAADKGTATFSDFANEISLQRNYWLGDAFASGGSAGYDHKKMAITARGAWESVKRHFRELGKDVQAEDFTVVGVGDMSGDVFGNGMLLSQHIRLLAAFNHLHVFLDPDPDPLTSWKERQRLFNLPRSTWADYDPAALSPGGGVFERSVKAIALTPEVKAAFGLEEESLSPAELICKLLSAQVELLWFGGIGTFVKASEESHAQAGDRNNDALRVDASDLNAKVIGEGANLGMTQRARIEYAREGGRLNTDWIDNSAGVDLSDHEVNIKILLSEVEAAGDMTRKQRDELLRKMSDEVAELVLRDNYLQTQTITVTQQLGVRLVDRTVRFIRHLERSGRLDRRIEALPDDETLAERVKASQGFTRPEIAVLLSYSKIELYNELHDSGLPDAPFLSEELVHYFPTPLRRAHRAAIARHRLRREIVATVITNDVINRVGITFVHEVRARTGTTAEDVVRAYVASREIFGLRELWARIEALDNQVPAKVQAAMLAECGRLIERATVWLLREEAKPLVIRDQVERYAAGVEAVGQSLETILSEKESDHLAELAKQSEAEGAPEELARLVARLPFLAPAGYDIVRIARDTAAGVDGVGRVYFAVGERLGFDWLRWAAALLPNQSSWDKQATAAIVDDLYGNQSELTRRIVTTAAGGELDEDLVDRWFESRRSQFTQTEQLLAELKSGTPSLAMLAVANRQLKSLAV